MLSKILYLFLRLWRNRITDLRKFAVSRAKNASKEIVLENRMEMPILLTRPELELERSFDSVLSEKDSNSNNI